MSNLHQVLNEGSVTNLGPIQVTSVYPMKPGDKSLFVLVQDGSGKGALKIWGPAAHCGIQNGQSITVNAAGPKGSIKTSVWNNKTSIDCNDCEITIVGTMGGAPQGQAAPQGRYAQEEQRSPQPSFQGGLSLDDKVEATARQAARWTSIYVDDLVVNGGFSRDEAIMLAQGSAGGFPLFWFGEKGI